MTLSHAIVVGGGVAGVAAAWALMKRGVQVTVLEDRAGSSEFASGMVYGAPEALVPAVHGFVQELALWRAWQGEWNVTSQGQITRSLAADRALLDLSALAGKIIGVADLGRDDWDGELIAGVLNEQAWAMQTHTRFVAVAVSGLRSSAERRIPAADFAALHDEPERAEWLAARLAEQKKRDAWLLGPWLGLVEDVAVRLGARLQVPVGESASRPGGAAGVRWSQARSRLFTQLGIVPDVGRLSEVNVVEGGVELSVTCRDGQNAVMRADAVILATGGVAAGGIVLTGSLAAPNTLGLELGYRAPLFLELDGELLAAPDSRFPASFQSELGGLERVGVNPAQFSGDLQGRLAVAGDLMVGTGCTIGAAVGSGVLAAESLLSAF